jgi:biopolymer transport protein ExbB
MTTQLRLRNALHTAMAAALLVVAPMVAAQEQPAATDAQAAAATAADAAAGAMDAATGAMDTAAGAMDTTGGMTDPMATGTGTDPMAAAAPAAEEAPATIEAPAQETAVVENPYGLRALWQQGDFVSKGTLIILVIMSVFSWYILFAKLIYQQKLISQFKAVGKQFWTAASLKDGANKLSKDNVFRMIVEDGLAATQHHEGKLTDQIDLHEWVTMSLQRAVESVNSELQTGLAFLATVGSTAPFVGLFGTVWGIYHALIAIGIAGQASIDKVAGPVGEALIMTAIGLAVAVPAVLSYNWLVRRNKVAMENLRNFSSDVHAVLLSGKRVGAAPAGGR